MEQPLFAPGDRVVCVDSSKGRSLGLMEGREYTIIAIKRKSCCGSILVHVGITGKSGSSICRCGVKKPLYDNINWKSQTRFVPVDFDRYAEETFHQSLKGKPVNA